MIWDEDPFDPGQWHRLGVNIDSMLHASDVYHLHDSDKSRIPDCAGRGSCGEALIGSTGNLWEAMVSKLAVLNKRKELIQSEEIRNDHFLLMRRRARHRVYDLKRRIKKGYRPKTPKVCEECSNDFLANRTDQKYCSKNCREHFYKRQKNGLVAKD